MADQPVPAYGDMPLGIGHFPYIGMSEVMHYLYLPVLIPGYGTPALPPNVSCLEPLLVTARDYCSSLGKFYSYWYVTACKGWASPDNPLNRPGWHCDGFGTDDMNFLWWVGPGTRSGAGPYSGISADHLMSLKQFDAQEPFIRIVDNFPESVLYAVHPKVVHATPLIEAPGCWRQFVKISASNERYNLEDNSHNYLLKYDWPLVKRDTVRNDTSKAGADRG